MARLTKIDDEYIRSIFSRNLKRILDDKKISQKAFSEMMGVSQTHMSRMIAGAQSPTFKTFAEICSLLDVSPRNFFEPPRMLRPIDKQVSGI